MQTITLADIPAQLWRNGAGLTRPIASGLAGVVGRANARLPTGSTPHLDAFDWRISLADIRGDGPFSVFPGIDRCAVLLGDSDITGMTLSGPGGSAYLLPLQPVSFPGEAELDARCEPGLALTKPRILNLMVRRNTMRSEVSVVDAAYRCPAAAVLFVLIAAGRWEFVAPDQTTTTLSLGQAGLIHALADGAILRPAPSFVAGKAVLVILRQAA